MNNNELKEMNEEDDVWKVGTRIQYLKCQRIISFFELLLAIVISVLNILSYEKVNLDPYLAMGIIGIITSIYSIIALIWSILSINKLSNIDPDEYENNKKDYFGNVIFFLGTAIIVCLVVFCIVTNIWKNFGVDYLSLNLKNGENVENVLLSFKTYDIVSFCLAIALCFLLGLYSFKKI